MSWFPNPRRALLAGCAAVGLFSLSQAAQTPAGRLPIEADLDVFVEDLPANNPEWDDILDAAGATSTRVFRVRMDTLQTLGPGLKRLTATLPGSHRRATFFRRKLTVRSAESLSLSGNVQGEASAHWALTVHDGQVIGEAWIGGAYYRLLTLEPGIHAWIEAPAPPQHCSTQEDPYEND